MQEIEIYCKKCKKSMKMTYTPSGSDDTVVMNGMMIRCHTNKCTRVITLKKYTEGQLVAHADAKGRCYL